MIGCLYCYANKRHMTYYTKHIKIGMKICTEKNSCLLVHCSMCNIFFNCFFNPINSFIFNKFFFIKAMKLSYLVFDDVMHCEHF